jgi:prophage antirepressor-like protein
MLASKVDGSSLFTFKSQQITVVSDEENNPWFNGNEVAKILGYFDTKKAIKKIPIPEDVLERQKIRGGTSPPLTFNEKTTLYINESGLYALIFSSKLPVAREFTRWVTSEVLPSIRKQGEFHLQEQIAIKTKEIEKFAIQKEKLEEAVGQRYTQLEEQNLKITKLEEENIQWKQSVENLSEMKKEHVLYIATTNQYSRMNYFKVGGVSDKLSLKGRLAIYNTGRPKEDLYFYVNIFQCNNFRSLENLISNSFKPHKLDRDKEMYNLSYSDLEHWIELFVEDSNKYIDALNTSRAELFANARSVFVKLEPLIIEQIIVTNIRKSSSNEVTTSVETLEESGLENVLREVYEERFRKDSRVKRKDLECEMTNRKYSIRLKKSFWSKCKDLLKKIDPDLVLVY